MKAASLVSSASLKNSKFWLLGIAASLIAIHLTLLSRTNDASLLGTGALFWLAVSSLSWSKRHTLSLNSGIFSSFCGALLISLVLFRSLFVSEYDPFIRISPLVSAGGFALLASGFKGAKQYWKELLILCFLAPSPGAIALVLDISSLTAQFATAILWYLGFGVSRQGVYITLSTGSVEVYPGCSGMESILQLLGLSVLFLMTFPTSRSKQIIVPAVAVFIAFLVNAARVALMAILVSPSTHTSFNYWHKGDGSLLFSMISVLIFGLFCLFIIRPGELEDNNSGEF